MPTTNAKLEFARDEAPAQWLRRLWERMTALYGHSWLSVHGVSPQASDGSMTIHGETWAKVLSGLSGTQIGRGLEACMASGGEFPPSAPRFRAMCLQLPSFATVSAEFLEATRAGERAVSPFARLVYQFLDYERYRYGDKRAAGKALRDAYEVASDHLLRGGSCPPEPAAAISHATTRCRELTEEECTAMREVRYASFEKVKTAVLDDVMQDECVQITI